MPSEHTMKELIEAALKSCNFDATIRKGEVEQAYRAVVGEFIVKLTRRVSYDCGSRTLRVVLSSPALKNELSFKTGDLMRAINGKVGRDEVGCIVLD